MSPAQPPRSPYVQEIGRNLRDVPWAKREALLDDVSTHLSDAGLATDELDAWVERFGTPEEYARQLRSDLELPTDPKSLHRARLLHLRTMRLRSRLLLATAVVLATVGIGGYVYVQSWFDGFQPFRFEGQQSAYGGRSTDVGNQSEHVWTWKQGGQFAIAASLHNTSDKTIRVKSIALDTDKDFSVPWDNWRIRLAPSNGDYFKHSERPVTPFTLRPDEDQLVAFRGDFVKCSADYQSGSSGTGSVDLTVGGAIVTFEVHGRTLTRHLNLGFTYGVKLAANYNRACHPK
jgi:hypothetical protein